MKYLPLSAMVMFRNIFEKRIEKYNPNAIIINEYERAYIFDDSLILLVSFDPVKPRSLLPTMKKDQFLLHLLLWL